MILIFLLGQMEDEFEYLIWLLGKASTVNSGMMDISGVLWRNSILRQLLSRLEGGLQVSSECWTWVSNSFGNALKPQTVTRNQARRVRD